MNNAMAIPAHDGPSSLSIPAFALPPNLDESDASAMSTASQAEFLDSYPVPPATPSTPTTRNLNILAGVASVGKPISPPTEKHAPNAWSNTVEKTFLPNSEKSVEGAGDGILEPQAIAILERFKKEAREQVDSLLKGTESLDSLSCPARKPLPLDFEENHIERVGLLFENAEEILENLDKTREQPDFRMEILRHCTME
jgi:hypothetical protein